MKRLSGQSRPPVGIREGDLIDRAGTFADSLVLLHAELLIGSFQSIGIMAQLRIDFFQTLLNPALGHLLLQGVNRLLAMEALAEEFEERNLHKRPTICSVFAARKRMFKTIKTTAAGDHRVNFKSVSSG